MAEHGTADWRRNHNLAAGEPIAGETMMANFWMNGTDLAIYGDNALRRAVRIAGSFHVALAELGGAS